MKLAKHKKGQLQQARNLIIYTIYLYKSNLFIHNSNYKFIANYLQINGRTNELYYQIIYTFIVNEIIYKLINSKIIKSNIYTGRRMNKRRKMKLMRRMNLKNYEINYIITVIENLYLNYNQFILHIYKINYEERSRRTKHKLLIKHQKNF